MLATVCSPLLADWKITTKETSGPHSSVTTEYFKGRLMRTDFLNVAFTILDFEHSRYLAVDVPARQYAVRRFDSHRSPSRAKQHPFTVVVDVETTDTGRRREKFGRMARHVLTREQRHDEAPGQPASFSELLTEGWYVDAPSLPPYKRSFSVAVFSTSRDGPPAVKVNRKGPIEDGLAVWKKTKRVYPGLESYEHLSEVTELVEGELDPKLFAPPAGFERVIQLRDNLPSPWSEELLLYWEWVQDWWRDLLAGSGQF